jgi:adenylate cyclase
MAEDKGASTRLQLLIKSGKFLIPLFVALGAFVISTVVAGFPTIGNLELKSLDLLFLLRGRTAPPPELVIVAVDEPSFTEMQLQWPWPRSVHGELVRKLHEAGAAVIGFDVLFSEPSAPQEDRALEAAMRKAKNVVLASELAVVNDPAFKYTTRVLPHQPFEKAAAAVGLAQIKTDMDVSVRRAQLIADDSPTLAYQVLRIYLQKANNPELSKRLPSPREATREVLIGYVGPPRSIKTVSYYQALDLENSLPKDFFKDRIVMVGRSSKVTLDVQRAIADSYTTPFSLAIGEEASQMAGVEIHANIVASVLGRRSISLLSDGTQKLLFLAIAVGAAFGLVHLRPLVGAAATGVVMAGYGLLTIALFVVSRVSLPTTVPMFELALVSVGTILIHYTTTERERQLVRDKFSQMVAPSVLKEVMAMPEGIGLQGRRVESATVFFSDLAGFTTFTESQPAEEVFRIVNEYLHAFTEQVFANDGTLDKYVGDAVMAVWGAPKEDKDHALKACRTALACQQRMVELRAGWARRGYPGLSARIGINSGPLVAGQVGSSKRFFQYSVIGDTVNAAARLEGSNKLFGTGIMIGETTYQLVKSAMVCRELDTLHVKGKEEALTVYEVLAPGGGGEQPPELVKLLEAYSRGLELYKRGVWKKAAEAFAEALQVRPEDGPSTVYLKRCQERLVAKKPAAAKAPRAAAKPKAARPPAKAPARAAAARGDGRAKPVSNGRGTARPRAASVSPRPRTVTKPPNGRPPAKRRPA